MSYSELLKDPRWQRKRLEILTRDDWKCVGCMSPDKTLHVHHKAYRKGAKPWEYESDELQTLCHECHEERHQVRALIDKALGEMDSFDLEVVLGYAEALVALRKSYDQDLEVFNPKFEVRGAAHAEGVGNAVDIGRIEGYQLFARDGVTTGYLRRIFGISAEARFEQAASIWDRFPWEIED